MRPVRGAIAALLAVATCELFSLAVMKFAFDAPWFPGTTPFRKHLDEDIESESPWITPMLAHPYFGLQRDKTHPPPRGRINNYGFQDPVDYPYVKKPGECVIGILGGSTPNGM